MLLTRRNAVPYLLARGLLEPEDAVDGDLCVQEVPRRHRNFKVIRSDGTGLFVKQARQSDELTLVSLRREAGCYELAAADPRFAALGELLPTFRGHDPARNVLVVELLADSEDLAAHHHRLGAYPAEIGSQLGASLAELHQAVDTRACDDRSLFPRAVPWALSAATLRPDPVTPATTELLAIVARHPEFEAVLGEMRDEWQPTTLIHGDVRWDNWLVRNNGGGSTAPLALIDFELADVGDPVWDVGAVFQAYVTRWVLSAPATPVGRIPVPVEPIADMQPAMGAFWDAYADAIGIAPADRPRWLERSARAAAARMIQTAYEACAVSPTIHPHTIALVQLSMNMLERPGEAVDELLGL